jgi:hypothetical protein
MQANKLGEIKRFHNGFNRIAWGRDGNGAVHKLRNWIYCAQRVLRRIEEILENAVTGCGECDGAA